MKYLVRRSTAHNPLHTIFTYIVHCPTVPHYLQLRSWCEETWGTSVEYHWWCNYNPKITLGTILMPRLPWPKNQVIEDASNLHWCYDSCVPVGNGRNKIQKKPRIYLRSNSELAMYHLRWS